MDGHLAKPLHIDELRAVLDGIATQPPKELRGSGPGPVNLDRMLDQLGGDVELTRQILAMVAEQVPPKIRQLQQSIQSGHLPELRGIVHTLKGMLSYLHSEAVSEAIRGLERSLGSTESVQLAEQVSRFGEWMKQLLGELPAVMTQLSGSEPPTELAAR
jgi:HPt (histidine-containing phosphotransfer) domain-containing protein